ncbi:hypothetical protein DYP60_12280 [Sphaerochaeta halotolerans]|jgi:beta-lactamase regulating signal transducer with metallopeptidase domain|uniref:Uncharacterized protein n=1 Tax=Sphaerochaeta halotolerans TaxID=2293840 RepID=A0A372MEP9_9SPIR|nr:hypothetical protein [Sphaerochaeta halotolerans]MDN5333532.1 hypothetical protein [Sphaerochaeta sp.]RFU93933.1 hypothetical protein DYP60_12280 [Sphaerochaeta halotolerans]
MWFLILFAIVFVLVLAFKSNKKEETITRTDQETGKTIVEKRTINTPSAGQTAARGVLWIIGIIIMIFILLIVIGAMMY